MTNHDAVEGDVGPTDPEADPTESDSEPIDSDVEQRGESVDRTACVPKSAEQLIEEHESQLDALLADVESPDETGGRERDSLSLSLPGLSLDRRDFMKTGVAVGAAGGLAGCSASFSGSNGASGTPASESGGSVDHGVPPGEHDEYYGFWSGGHSGEIRVVGMPSMRVLTRIPVFQSESAKGYGYDEQTKALLEEGGGYEWGDTHHPILSETDGEYDGRWLFINDKANGRMARIDLKYFETDAITDVPNVQALHGCSVQSPNTKYVYGVSEFRHPVPNDGTADPDDPDQYGSLFTALDPESMDVQWQVMVSGNMDNSDSSKDGKWAFATGYNDEEGFEIEEMSHDDRDYLKAFDVEAIEKAVEAGNHETMGGVPVVDARDTSEFANHPESEAGSTPLVHYVPVPKSPHGCDVEPTGKYVTASGKLSPTVTIIRIDEIAEVDNLEDAVVGQPKVGMGPLHTTWDGRGHGYTTLFIDSQIAKWDIEKAVEAENGSEEPVLGKIDVHYNPGHLQAAGAESTNPSGDWLISLNKLSKDRFLPVGPIHPDNDQLIYIGEDKDDEAGGMELVADEPVYPEPHDCVIAHRDSISPAKVWDKADYEGEKEFVTEENSRIERVDDTTVEVYTASKRSEYGLRDIRVKEGDEVHLTVTNIEASPDIIHGVAVPQHDINLSIAPQDTRQAVFTVDDPGVYWIYCTYFCSALHLEMRSRLIVEPRN
jgi:nitrous-oxide reductase